VPDYGLVSRGIFQSPPGFQRYSPSANEDPWAALIGNALGAFTGVTEKQKADKLAALKESDETNDRNTRLRIEAYAHGLRPDQPQSPDLTPQIGAQLGGADRDTSQELPGPSPIAPRQAPVATIGGTPFVPGPEQGKFEHVTGPSGEGFAFDPRTGHYTSSGVNLGQKPLGYHIEFADDGTGKQTGKWVPDAPPPGTPTGPSGVATVPGLTRTPLERITPKQRESAGNGIAAQSADQDLRTIENANPTAIGEVARWVAAPSIGRLVPGIGGGIENVLRQARSAGLSDPAFTYLKRMFDFASIAGPARYGRRFGSEIALQQIWNDFGAGQIGIGQGGVAATQKNRGNAVRAIRTAAGEPAWAEAQLVPETGGGTGASLTPPPSVNPRFDPRKKQP
jgi:hypothetical protein